MKRFLKIALITIFAITMIVGCETEKKIKEASNEDVLKFVQAYYSWNNTKTDLSELKAIYDFDFTYNAYDENGPKTSKKWFGDESVYKNFIKTYIVATIANSNENIKGYMESKLGETNEYSFAFDMDGEFTVKKVMSSIIVDSGSVYELTVKFKDFAGNLCNVQYDSNDDGTVDSKIGETLTSVFGDGTEENPYKKVTYSFINLDSTPSVTIEGFTDKSEYEYASKLATALWNFLIAEGYNDNGPFFKNIIDSLKGEEYKGLNSYSYTVKTENPYNIGLYKVSRYNGYFDEIKDIELNLDAKVTEDSVVPSRYDSKYICPYYSLYYILAGKIDADITLTATLDGEDYVYTYSTVDEILTINGKKYSCSVEKMSLATQLYGKF